jgi:hypothetical protein
MDLVAKYHWWPNLATEVQNYVKGCAECQRHKINTQARKAPLSPITPVHKALPFQTIVLDFIVKLPVMIPAAMIRTLTFFFPLSPCSLIVPLLFHHLIYLLDS